MNYYIEKDYKKHMLLIILAAVVGILYTIFFHDTIRLGINYPAFMLLVFVFTYIMLDSNNFNKKTYLILTFVNFLYAAGFAVYMNNIIRSLSFIAVPVFYIITVLLSQNYNITFIKFLKSLFVPFLYIFSYFKNIAANFFKTKNMSAQNRNVLFGILISIILLAIIIPIMLSSDIVLKSFFKHWFINFTVDVGDIFYYLFFFALSSAYAYGFIRFMLEKRITLNENSEKYTIENSSAPDDKIIKNYNTQIFIVLLVSTAVYAIFCTFQTSFLIYGNIYGHAHNFDYAQYARSGFFQLMALTFINIAVILAIFKLSGDKTTFGIKLLLNILTFLTLILALSSLYRMHLYEQEYGYTILRLLVYIILIYEFIVIMLILLKIKNIKFPFIKIAFIIGLVFYLAASYMNIDAYVAKKNIDRYFKTGKLDTYYLGQLSTDAAKQIMRLENEKNDEIESLIKNNKFIMQNYIQSGSIRNFNYSVNRAVDIYKAGDEKVYKITLINGGSTNLTRISLSNGEQSQVVSNKIEPWQQCVFFIYDSNASYTIEIRDENSATYKQTIETDFKNKTETSFFINNNNGTYQIEKSEEQ